MNNEVLLIPEKVDVERESIAKLWDKLGGTVLRIGKFWEPPKLNPNSPITIYGNDTFSLVLAQVLKVELISPNDALIAEIPNNWIKRPIKIIRHNALNQLTYPRFIKPVQPKLFQSKVYATFNELETALTGINPNEELITSAVIAIECEARAFILNNKILDVAIYEGNGEVATAIDFISNFLINKSINLPKTYVLDVGYNNADGWFIIELNATWGAGLNGCNPNKVINAIQAATINTSTS